MTQIWMCAKMKRRGTSLSIHDVCVLSRLCYVCLCFPPRWSERGGGRETVCVLIVASHFPFFESPMVVLSGIPWDDPYERRYPCCWQARTPHFTCQFCLRFLNPFPLRALILKARQTLRCLSVLSPLSWVSQRVKLMPVQHTDTRLQYEHFKVKVQVFRC